MSRPVSRQASAADTGRVCRTLALAFADDPVWGRWAFPDPADRVTRLTAYWQPFISAGLRHGGVWTTPDCAAVAVWVPPGVAEMDEDDEAVMVETVHRLCGENAPTMLAAFELFASTREQVPAHWYLSLLGTHPDSRGSGLAMGLVADHLERVDAEHQPSYLESTNDANLGRYQRVGYDRHGSFVLPDAGPTVTTMWRPAR